MEEGEHYGKISILLKNSASYKGLESFHMKKKNYFKTGFNYLNVIPVNNFNSVIVGDFFWTNIFQ